MKKLFFLLSIIFIFSGDLFAQSVGVASGFAQRGGGIEGITFDGEGIVVGSPADSFIVEIPMSIEATLEVIISAVSAFTIAGGQDEDGTLILDADAGDDDADTWTIKSEATGNDLSILNHETEVFNLTSAGNLQIDGTFTGSSTGSFESTLTINPTVVEGEDPSIILKFDADSDSPANTAEALTIKGVAASDPTDAVVAFTQTQGNGYTFDKQIQVKGGAEDTNIRITTTATGHTSNDGYSFAVQNSTQAVFITQRENADLFFFVNGVERVNLQPDGDVHIGGTVVDELRPSFSILGDADSDGTTTSETLTFSQTAASDPTTGLHTVTNTQNAGIDFDMPLIATSVTTDGALTANGVFTSLGIDDNADANAITISSGEVVTFVQPPVFAGYTVHLDIQASAATLGPTAPTLTTVGTARGLGFDADAELVNFHIDIPTDWNASSDMTLVVHWFSTSGDAIANTEDVKWDVTYRSVAEGEAIDNGTAVTATASFTGGASELDKEHYMTSVTIDFDNGNQPLTAGDAFVVQFDRDVSGEGNSYSGAGIVMRWDLLYTSVALPAH